MEILKKSILALGFFISSLYASAQNQTELLKAFSDSYTQEYAKNYGEAINSLTKVYDANSYEINLRLGWLQFMNKNYAQSQLNYQNAAKLKPYSIEARLGLVKPLSALESWDKVLAIYDEIIQIDPQHYTANYWTGVINYNRKKYDKAAKYFETIVNLYPFDYDGNHMLGWTYLNMGRNNDARILFQKALLYNPTDASSLQGLSKIK